MTLAFAALVAIADVYASGAFRWVQGVQGSALDHYGNTSDIVLGVARARDGLELSAGILVEGWFGHAPFGKGPGAADAYVSPGVEAAASWRLGASAWRLGPRVAVADSGASSAADDHFGDRRRGVPPVVTLGVRARLRERWCVALDVVRAASPTPDAPAPDDRAGTSVAFGVGFVVR